MQSRTETTPQDDGEIERSLLSYLRGHPQAADTLEGIIEWWLPLQRYETARLRIEDALERLVADGTLRRDLLHDGVVLYALRDEAH
jgi:hypothetical protein